jgi:sortase (surface protein transpeptidase)
VPGSTGTTGTTNTDPGPPPARLRIPAVDVDAGVAPVGVTPAGAMVIPEEARRVGWYRYGSAPGDAAGAAVLAGHVDSREQGPGALFRLRDASVGDTVAVTRADGRELAYRIVGKQVFVKQRLPVERLFARDGAPRLVLITCGGPFLEELSSYRDNLVVVAEPVRAGGTP